jgi:hypothetical protein
LQPTGTWQTASVRGFVIGLLLIGVLTTSVLSLRPGGLRNQLRHMARRLKLALVLAGIYLALSAILRLALGDGLVTETATALTAVVLAVIFITLSAEH